MTAAQTQELANLQPYTTAGTNALTPLQSDIAQENNPANQFSFTPQQFQQNPEYAFEMQQQQLALQQQAAAKGGALGGGAIKASQTLANNLTSTNYGTAFNQALQTYTTNRQNTLNQIAGYQNLVGTGLSATNTGNNAIQTNAGLINQSNAQIAANNIAAGQYAGNAGLTAAQIQEQALTGAANAKAAGTVGQANATTGAINGVSNAAGTYALYQGLNGGLTNPYGTGNGMSSNGSWTGGGNTGAGQTVNWGTPTGNTILPNNSANDGTNGGMT